MSFTHLHIHSHYSLLNALPKIKELIEAAKKDGLKAMALTDNGSMYGAIEFYKACRKEDIKPILGIDAYLSLRSRHDKQAGIDNKRTRLVLLAKDLSGYKNLLKLSTLSFFEGFYYKPRIDKELLEKHNEGLICIASAMGSDISISADFDDFEKAKEQVSWYQNIFGKENFYLEITHHPESQRHNKRMDFFKKLSLNTGVPLVASQEVYYLKPEDKKIRDIMLSIQTNSSELRSSNFEEDDFSFIDQKTANKYFKDIPEALENNQKIADSCNLELKLGEWFFPDIQVESGKDHNDELRDVVYEGLTKRNLELTAEIKKRIEYELDIIKTKGYAPYFLVVADLLNFARENKIMSTTRGSSAGSLVSFLTFITTVNPIEYKLPFERFLNPERPSAPDIDMDFADNRRDEVIQYAKRKYGEDKVAQIGTFGTMMARGSVRDVARALGYPYSTGDRIAKLIPFGAQGFPMTIDRALKEVPELKEIYKKEKDVKDIIDTAKKIEGCARHISVHAAGVVIAPGPLTDYVALQYDTKGEGKIITQYDMHAVEDAGLLKFDFLGIKNLSILANAVELANKLENKNIDIENIPLDDKKTFELLSKGETTGLFQLNGQGMTRFLKELKPTTIHDINAMVALYRPGPMESIPQYIERKHNPLLVKYLDPRMKNILDNSYGVITYQDDVLEIAIQLAGFSWLEADKLRKAMGKKIPAEMKIQKQKLLEGFVEHGMTKEKADELWKLIEPFAAYGFNRAHAASYGMVAYQTAFMKANFPVIYMTSVLTADSGDIDKISEAVAECKRMNISVLPPSVNESFEHFTVVKQEKKEDCIRFGLSTIKNLGEGISKTIIEERKKGGRFKNLTDFLSRIKDRNLNKKSLEALIKAGALDELGERGSMLSNLELLLQYHKEKSDEQNSNQVSLFGNSTDDGSSSDLNLAESEEASSFDKLSWEKELLGLYLSGHPLDRFKEKLEKYGQIKKIKEEAKEGQPIVFGGIIEEVKKIITKKGENMAFMKIADYNENIESVIFPKTLKEAEEIAQKENCVAVKGKFSKRNGTPSVIVEKIKLISQKD